MRTLQIRNVGKMWRVYNGTTVLAFATDFAMAQYRRHQLIAEGAAERVALRNELRRAQQCQN